MTRDQLRKEFLDIIARCDDDKPSLLLIVIDKDGHEAMIGLHPEEATEMIGALEVAKNNIIKSHNKDTEIRTQEVVLKSGQGKYN